MIRWHSSGQSCINPSMAFPLYRSPLRGFSRSWPPYWAAVSKPRPAPRLPRPLARATAAFAEIYGSAARLVSGEPRQPKTADVVGGRPRGREVGEDLADHGREFEAMARAGRRDDDLRKAGHLIENEI